MTSKKREHRRRLTTIRSWGDVMLTADEIRGLAADPAEQLAYA